MSPALEAGDYVLARTGYVASGGGIVVFEGPAGRTVKRVVTEGPAVVTIEGGVVLVDGDPHADPWVGATRPDGRWPVATGQVFVLGDNRPHSDGDSRGLGPIDIGRVEATVLFRYWPLSRR